MDGSPAATPTDVTGSAPAPATRAGAPRWSTVAAVAGVAFLCLLALRFGSDAGAIWDDDYHRVNGDNVLEWFATGFTDRSALTTEDLYLYGALFDAPAQLLVRVSPLGEFETRHVLTALVGILGVIAAFKTAALLSGRRAGFLAAALLALTPVWLGHALMNPKDIPFAAFAAWAVYAAVRIAVASRPLSWGDAALAGVTVGAAAGVRAGGMSLLAYVFAAAIGRAVVSRGSERGADARREGLRSAAATAARLGLAVLVAWALMVSFWPWAQLSPLAAPLKAIAESAHFHNFDKYVLFGGAWYKPASLPRSYLPTWFAIALPEVWAVAMACTVAAAIAAVRRGAAAADRRRLLAFGLVALAALGPVTAAVLLRPILYDAQRHFLFVLPPAAVLCGVGFSEFLSLRGAPRWVRASAAVAAGALALLAVADVVRLHPYEYVFVNRLGGGLPGAAGRYEADYWGASYREGVEWVVRNVPGAQRPLRVAGCGLDFQVAYYLEESAAARGRFEPVRFSVNPVPDLVLATTRWNCHRRVPGRVLHVVEREGVPLLYVIEVYRPS